MAAPPSEPVEGGESRSYLAGIEGMRSQMYRPDGGGLVGAPVASNRPDGATPAGTVEGW